MSNIQEPPKPVHVQSPTPASAPPPAPDHPRWFQIRFWYWMTPALLITLAAAFIYGPPLVVLHVMPRLGLSANIMRKANELALSHEKLFDFILSEADDHPGPGGPLGRWLTPMPIRSLALTSRSRAVRHNMFQTCFTWRTKLPGRYLETLLRVCERTPPIAAPDLYLRLFMDSIGSRYDGPQNKPARAALLERVRRILALNKKPELVLICIHLFNQDCEPQDQALVRQAASDFLDAPPAYQLFPPIALSLLAYPSMEQTPYEVLVEMGHLPTDPAQLSTVPPDKLSCLRFAFLVNQDDAMDCCKAGGPVINYEKHPCWDTFDPKQIEQYYARSLADLRVADLFFEIQKIHLAQKDTLMIPSYLTKLGPEQRRHYNARVQGWFATPAADPAQHNDQAAYLDQILGCFTGNRFSLKTDAATYEMIESLLQTPWKDEPCTSSPPVFATYGQWIEQILADRPAPEQEDAAH